MKSLKRLRLINWHRFTNETIGFSDAVLLSGENGAGKSTILDAIQLVVTASKNNFNKAAQEKGKRTLNTYIRCKTGREDRPYERTGELSAHVALEFFDEPKNSFFIIGCAMDSAMEETDACDPCAERPETFLQTGSDKAPRCGCSKAQEERT